MAEIQTELGVNVFPLIQTKDLRIEGVGCCADCNALSLARSLQGKVVGYVDKTDLT